jgi:hypothetical protein
MTWFTLPIFTAATLTVAQMNIIRDNLMSTAPAMATLPGQYFAATGVNAIVARRAVRTEVDVIGTTTSTAYTPNLTPVGGGTTNGPVVTADSSSHGELHITSYVRNTDASDMALMSYVISGATTLVASDKRSLGSIYATYATMVMRHSGLIPGSNTFTANYRTAAGGTTGQFDGRVLAFLPY